ncbi:hypothetical protein NMG60_11013972 [Bertholletia excelsa]
MSSVLCQGLQTCLEPRLVEPRVLRHKLAPPRSTTLAQSVLAHKKEEGEEHGGCSTKISNNGEVGGWSFLKAIAITPHIGGESIEKDQKPYVHPLVKRSSTILSKKSLEMCTESLGSETGSEISESSEEVSLRVERSPEPREFSIRRRTSGGDGGALPPPPPLTSAGGVRLKTHREGDRLVVEAVAITHQSSCFKAERGGGRLRLCLVEENYEDYEKDEEVTKEHEFDGEEEEEDEVGEEGGREGNYGKFGGEGEIGGLFGPRRCTDGGGESKEMSRRWGPFLRAMC